MRILINERLSFGNESACTDITDGTIAVVHACKEPCHRGAVGYSTRTISSSHPNYLVLRARSPSLSESDRSTAATFHVAQLRSVSEIR